MGNDGQVPHREPILLPVKVGWAAHGLGWAVHAPTREAVIQKYRERERLYAEVEARGYWNERPKQQAVKRQQQSDDGVAPQSEKGDADGE